MKAKTENVTIPVVPKALKNTNLVPMLRAIKFVSRSLSLYCDAIAERGGRLFERHEHEVMLAQERASYAGMTDEEIVTLFNDLCSAAEGMATAAKSAGLELARREKEAA